MVDNEQAICTVSFTGAEMVKRWQLYITGVLYSGREIITGRISVIMWENGKNNKEI